MDMLCYVVKHFIDLLTSQADLGLELELVLVCANVEVDETLECWYCWRAM